jgi:hypothetical protein
MKAVDSLRTKRRINVETKNEPWVATSVTAIVMRPHKPLHGPGNVLNPLFTPSVIIIIIIIIRHELGLNWPCLIVSLKVFPVIMANLVYTLALFLASRCSFFIYVLASLIRTFLVSGQLVLISTPLKCSHSFCGQRGCTPLSFWNNSSQFMSIVFLSLFWKHKFYFHIEQWGGGNQCIIYFYFWRFLNQSLFKSGF